MGRPGSETTRRGPDAFEKKPRALRDCIWVLALHPAPVVGGATALGGLPAFRSDQHRILPQILSVTILSGCPFVCLDTLAHATRQSWLKQCRQGVGLVVVRE